MITSYPLNCQQLAWQNPSSLYTQPCANINSGVGNFTFLSCSTVSPTPRSLGSLAWSLKRSTLAMTQVVLVLQCNIFSLALLPRPPHTCGSYQVIRFPFNTRSSICLCAAYLHSGSQGSLGSVAAILVLEVAFTLDDSQFHHSGDSERQTVNYLVCKIHHLRYKFPPKNQSILVRTPTQQGAILLLVLIVLCLGFVTWCSVSNIPDNKINQESVYRSVPIIRLISVSADIYG